MVRALLLGLTAILALQLPAEPQLQEQITVERILIDARVVDSRGDAILGLTPADFRVRIDGKPARVESVEWIAETAVARDLAEVNVTTAVPAPRGRLLVYLFQTDFARNSLRLSGHAKILLKADEYMEMIEPEDRVAVLSYDSHLKFRLDFSDDKQKIHDAMEQSLYTDEPPPPPIVPMPSIASRLDRKAMRDASTFEDALVLIANALRPIPGPKSIILFAWGMGRFGRDGVKMEWNYGIARHALEAARVSVFSIDVTQADYHSLEVGLGKVADDTGGFYIKSYHFPRQAIDRLQRALVGHYELEVRKPEAIEPRGAHNIEVDTTKRRAVVLARKVYVDKE